MSTSIFGAEAARDLPAAFRHDAEANGWCDEHTGRPGYGGLRRLIKEMRAGRMTLGEINGALADHHSAQKRGKDAEQRAVARQAADESVVFEIEDLSPDVYETEIDRESGSMIMWEPYRVRRPGGEWHHVKLEKDHAGCLQETQCDCRGFRFRQTCSHIDAVLRQCDHFINIDG